MAESRRLINEQLWKAVEEGNQRAADRLIKEKGDPNYKSTYRRVPNSSLLMVAAHSGQQSIVQLLLKHGATVNDANEWKWTALHYASRSNHYEIVQQLIRSGANVDGVNNFGTSSLHFAASRGHDRVVHLLIESKAKIDLQDLDGDTPLHLAASQNQGFVVKVLLANKANPDIKNKIFQYPHEIAHGDFRRELLRYWEEYRRAQVPKVTRQAESESDSKTEATAVVKTVYEEPRVDSKDLQSVTVSENRIFQAVLKCGVTEWSSIGLAVGLTGPQIESCTFDKPSPASKLEAIIELIVRKQSVKEAEKSLLTACEKIPQPVIGSVLEYIQSSSSQLGEYEKESMPLESGGEATKMTEESLVSSKRLDCKSTKKTSTKSHPSLSDILICCSFFVCVTAMVVLRKISV